MEQFKREKVSDLRHRGTKLVERLYGERVRYHLNLQQVQLDGEPIPEDLFYLVLHRDHGLNIPKRLAKEFLIKVAHDHPFSDQPGAPTELHLSRERVEPVLIDNSPEGPSGLSSWMTQLRSMMEGRSLH